MNFTIEKDTLLNNINNVSKALSNKIQMPGLTGILFNVNKDKIVLTASNNEISIQVNITDNFKVIEEGNFLLQGKYLIEIIKKINANEIDFISFEENTIKILAGKSVFTLNCLPLDSFPIITFDESPVKFTLDALNLKQIIRKTTFAISTNESRFVLTGVSLRTKDNKLTVIATDSYRLARKEIEFDYNFPELNIVIPGKSFDELYKIIEDGTEVVEISCSSTKIMFKYKNLFYQSRLIDGIYPKNVEKIIPNEFINRLTFNKEELISLIDRVSIFVTNELSSLIILTLTNDGNVEFSSESFETGAAKEAIQPLNSENNGGLQIAFSPRYFLDALRSFDSENVTISFTGEVKPFIITSDKDVNLVQLILPIRR